MNVAAAAQQFMLHGRVDRQYAAETRQKHRDCFSSWILPRIGHRELGSVVLHDVLNIRTEMLNRGLSNARVSSVLSLLKAFFGYCRSVLKSECLNPVEIRRLPKPKPVVSFLIPEEITRCRSELNPHRFTDLRTRAMFEFVLGTGVRVSEALQMDRTPFDQNQEELDIIGKGGKVRTIFLSDACRFWVKRFLEIRCDSHPALFITTGDPVRRWARADVSPSFIDLRMRAGLTRKLTPHLLRHTYCTTLLNNGVDITFIKELAGHEDIQTTARYYLGVDKPALRKIVKQRLHYPDDDAIDSTPKAA